MLQKLQKRKGESGFTIIEVLIVLAIAGLILLVVFLAVPALQRNSRNTQYRNEASRLVGAYNEASANNAGAVLTSSDSATVLAAANTKNITNLSIATYNTGTVPSTTDAALIRTNAKCQSANSSTTPQGTTRQIVILYNVETTSGLQIQCQEA
ncbi:MAG TPA: prepilin-type N-terminal cleavage/methylation domain-containing protein [Candidatus Saccharimonadales bacterium]|nr:prepilin-type N-terminal cleavage/methylation domain-containing protein [Candidatus Saccharimonadales bacterium]